MNDAITFGIGIAIAATIVAAVPATIVMVASWILEKIDDAIWERRRKQRQKNGKLSTPENDEKEVG